MKELVCDFCDAVKFGYKSFRESFSNYRETRILAKEASKIKYHKPILGEEMQKKMDFIRNKSTDGNDNANV